MRIGIQQDDKFILCLCWGAIRGGFAPLKKTFHIRALGFRSVIAKIPEPDRPILVYRCTAVFKLNGITDKVYFFPFA
jgi:hypothetical protein